MSSSQIGQNSRALTFFQVLIAIKSGHIQYRNIFE